MKKTIWKKFFSYVLSLSLILSMMFSLTLHAEDTQDATSALTNLKDGILNVTYDEALKATLNGTIKWNLNDTADLQLSEDSAKALYGIPDGLTLTEDAHLTGIPSKTGVWYFSLTENNGTELAKHLYLITIKESAEATTADSQKDDTPEAPKTDEPQDTPKTDEPQDTPKTDEPQDTPKTDEPQDTPKTDEPQDTPKTDEPQDTPKTDEPQDTPETDEPQDTPKTDEPQGTVTITTDDLISGTVGVAYEEKLSAEPLDTSFAWSTDNTALPPGIILNADGTLTGVPTKAGTFIFTITISGENEISASKDFTIVIEEAPIKPEITTTALPDGLTGTAYEHTFTANGTTPISWKLKDTSSLPKELTLTEDGKLSGTPSLAGSYPFTITAENEAGIVEKSFTLTIKEPEKMYTVTVTTDGNGIACPDITQAKAGTKITLMATANDGYRFKEWIIEKGNITLNNHTFILPEENVSIKAIFKKIPPEYKITQGTGGIHRIGDGKALTFTCNGDLKQLAGIYVDGNLIKSENYTVKSGSTILTLKPEYLDKLKVGTHTLKLKYGDGSVETTFKISKITSVKTGDNASTQIWLIVLGIAVITAAIVVMQKRKNH